jgi:hypothetical protein
MAVSSVAPLVLLAALPASLPCLIFARPDGNVPTTVAAYELLIDGRRRWKACSEDDVRTWLREYCDEHAADDPDAAHVQIRRLSRLAWLTGGTLVDRDAFLRER